MVTFIFYIFNLKLMRSFIQLTDTNNELLSTLSLGDLSSTSTFSFRLWNNLPNVGGVAAVRGLELNLMYPPKQGITTLVNQNTIKGRCTYSGERSNVVNMSFQTFPLSGNSFDRLEPNCYNEYEVQIDFSNLSDEQKTFINSVDMLFNLTVSYDDEIVPLSLPQIHDLYSDTTVLLESSFTILSDSTIV